jgi:hypothetical protein
LIHTTVISIMISFHSSPLTFFRVAIYEHDSYEAAVVRGGRSKGC